MQTNTQLRAAPSFDKVIANRPPDRSPQTPTLSHSLNSVSARCEAPTALAEVPGPIEDDRGHSVDPTLALHRVTLELEQALRENAAARHDNYRLARALHLAEARANACEHRADHDPLTGLPNRSAMARKLPSMLREALRARKPRALLFIDLDGFKAINDHHGHIAGDRVLVRVAHRLRSCVRDGDAAFRVGGDEFVVVMSPGDKALGAVVAVERIRTRLESTCRVAGIDHQVRASIGIGRFPCDATVAGTLLRIADASMYQDKADRRR